MPSANQRETNLCFVRCKVFLLHAKENISVCQTSKQWNEEVPPNVSLFRTNYNWICYYLAIKNSSKIRLFSCWLLGWLMFIVSINVADILNTLKTCHETFYIFSIITGCPCNYMNIAWCDYKQIFLTLDLVVATVMVIVKLWWFKKRFFFRFCFIVRKFILANFLHDEIQNNKCGE